MDWHGLVYDEPKDGYRHTWKASVETYSVDYSLMANRNNDVLSKNIFQSVKQFSTFVIDEIQYKVRKIGFTISKLIVRSGGLEHWQ